MVRIEGRSIHTFYQSPQIQSGSQATTSCTFYVDGVAGQAIKYYMLGKQRIALRQACGSGLMYLYQDRLGSKVATSTNGGESQRYWPYGLTRSGSVTTTHQFTGQLLAPPSGLYYYGARFYNPYAYNRQD